MVIKKLVFISALSLSGITLAYGDDSEAQITVDHFQDDMINAIRQLDKMPCGTHVDYWSTSCGAIASATSRQCSWGGLRINPSSCNTHFEPHSRGCGFAMLGCQSECRLPVRACDSGFVGFAASTCAVSDAETSVEVHVLRTHGRDGNVSVQVGVCNSTEGMATVSWGDADTSVKSVRVNFPDEEQHIQVCLQSIEGVPHSDHHTLTIRRAPPQAWAVFADHAITVSESDESISVRVQRMGAVEGPLSVRLVALAGSAIALTDYERVLPATLVWAEGDNRVQTVKIPLVNDNHAEEDETLVLGLLISKDLLVPIEGPAVATITIKNDDSPAGDEEENTYMKGKLRAFQMLSPKIFMDKDMVISHQALHYFEPRVLPAGTRLVRHSDVADLIIVTEYGSVESTLVRPILGPDKFLPPTEAPRTKYGPGRVFGLVESLTNSTYGVDLVTLEETKVWVTDRSFLAHFARRYPNRLVQFVNGLVKHTIRSMPKKPPVILFPGFMSTRLVAWKYKPCVGFPIEPLDVLWVSVEKVAQTMVSDPKCWLDCLALGPNQTDPADCVVRAMDGLEALTELVPGMLTTAFTTIFGALIRYMAKELAYNSIHMFAMPYDWRLSPDMMQERDGYFLRIKKRIEAIYEHNQMPAVAIGHSQGNSVFLHFMRWLEHEYPDQWEDWVERHVGSYYGLGAPLLGAHDAVHGLMIGNSMGMPFANSLAKNMALTFGTLNWFNPHNGNVSLLPHGQLTNQYRVYDRWNGYVANITWPNKTVTHYGADDVQSGRLFADMARETNDARFLNQLRILNSNYKNQAFNHIADGYARPPVKHVYMIYGINWDTVVAEAFNIHSSQPEPTISKIHLETKGGVIKDKLSGDIVGKNHFGKSGDSTVPYVSLSWAMLWHKNASDITVKHEPAKVIEYYDHPIGKWGEKTVLSLMNINEPAYSIYASKDESSGQTCTTSVIEIEGGGSDHRSLVKDPFIHKLITQAMIYDLRNDVGERMRRKLKEGTPADKTPSELEMVVGHDTLDMATLHSIVKPDALDTSEGGHLGTDTDPSKVQAQPLKNGNKKPSKEPQDKHQPKKDEL
eukprot:comp12311_c0_seq1/m.7154 comp12311_c0_seq1/g.7154  ORF comp12311_c0_seq1/g.7154 comp12311_c0_seq1/m.7154 type:complete len:1076 (-) comp12311_c0_seq1:32-3259(-)